MSCSIGMAVRLYPGMTLQFGCMPRKWKGCVQSGATSQEIFALKLQHQLFLKCRGLMKYHSWYHIYPVIFACILLSVFFHKAPLLQVYMYMARHAQTAGHQHFSIQIYHYNNIIIKKCVHQHSTINTICIYTYQWEHIQSPHTETYTCSHKKDEEKDTALACLPQWTQNLQLHQVTIALHCGTHLGGRKKRVTGKTKVVQGHK